MEGVVADGSNSLGHRGWSLFCYKNAPRETFEIIFMYMKSGLLRHNVCLQTVPQLFSSTIVVQTVTEYVD